MLKGNSLVRYCPSPKNHVCIIPKDVDYVEIGAFRNVEPTKVKIFAEYLNGDSIENIVLDGLSRPEIFCKPKTITWTSAESLGFNPNMISSKLTMFLQNEKDGGDCNVK